MIHLIKISWSPRILIYLNQIFNFSSSLCIRFSKHSTWTFFAQKPPSKALIAEQGKIYQNWINAFQKPAEQLWKFKKRAFDWVENWFSTIFMQVPFTFIHSLTRIICVIGCDPLSFQFTTLWRAIFRISRSQTLIQLSEFYLSCAEQEEEEDE